MSFAKQSADSYRFECMVDGKRFYKTYKSFNEPYSVVKQKFYEWKIECNKGQFVNSNYTFEEFANIWLNEYCSEYSPLVIKNYRCNLKNWILPKLGHYKLNKITPLHLDSFISYLKCSNNKSNGQAKITNGSISKIWQITHTIISTAYTKDLIPSNPCEKVKLELKKEIDTTLHYWDATTYQKALQLLSKEESDAARVIEFALKTGLRRSEIWGLTWNDIDFKNLTISVNKTLQKVNGEMRILPCKTASSVRVIALPMSLVSLLNKYREAHPESIYVFQNLNYDCVPVWFRKWQVRNNIPKIRFHDLRHTHASLLLYKQVDIKTISERLGHSNIGITMNTYTHVMRELDVNAAQAIDNI